MGERNRLDAFMEMLRRLREPHLIASRTGRILGANVAAADALSSTLTGLESGSLEDYSMDPLGLRAWLAGPFADGSLPLRARNGARFSCDASALAEDLVLLRLSGGPDGASRARSFVDTLAYLQGTAAGVAASETHAELARALLTSAFTSLGATSGGLYLLDETGTNLELAGCVAARPEEVERFRLIPMSAALPLTEAVRRSAAVFVGGREEFESRYPELSHAHPRTVAARAYAAIPFERAGRAIGAISVSFPSERTFGERDRAALEALARQCAEVFDWAQRVEGRRGDVQQDVRGASSLERLHAFTRTLAQAITPAQVAEAVVDVGMAATSARGGGLWLVSDDGAAVGLVRAVGPTGPRPEDHARVPLEPPGRRMPIVDAVRTGTPVWIESCQQMEKSYPEAFRAFSAGAEASLACIPLLAQGRCIGGLALAFAGTRRFDQEDRAFLQVLSWHAAQAIERARLYAAEKRARQASEASQRRSDFLVHAGALLASSLDHGATLAAVAQAAVPRIADWCIVDLDDRVARELAPVAAHVDEEKLPLVQEIAARMRAYLARAPGPPLVWCTGKAELHQLRTMDQAPAWVVEAGILDLVARVGVISSMTVPIAARGRTLGIISLNSSDPARVYGEQDLAMAEELGRRAGIAVDNARHYEEARDADRQKDEFLAMLSHELRNPLAPIVTALEMMRRGEGDAGSRERAIIARHVQHVVRLVDDLLDVARVTRGKIELRPEFRELAPIVGTAVEMTGPVVRERAQRLSVSVPEHGLVVRADAVRLAQAIGNLVVNASRYTEPGGAISVVALAEGAEAVVRVRDSGIGIAPETLPRVFDLFVQEKRALDRAQGGLGIGLTVVKGLVELHGGSVSAHSEGIGKGSEFSVRLPLVVGEAPVEAPPTSRAPVRRQADTAAHPLRVLVVDDNVDAADMLNQALHVLGCAVRVAYDGEEALAAAPAFAPDLALVDIGLPAMNGYELVGHLRRLAAAPRRIVAITGYGQASDYARSRDAGFDEHIVKPVDLRTLEKLLDRSRPA